MNILNKLKLIVPLLLVTLLFSCNDNESTLINQGDATITVRLVDAPGDYEAVNVEIVDVMIKMDDDSEDENGWMSLEANSKTVNLLDFTGGFSEVLVDRFAVPAGTLSQMRLVLGDGNTIVIENEEGEPSSEYDLKTPSGQQSGLKLKMDTAIEEGFTYDFIIDFDVEKSIVHAGNSGNIILKPVLYGSVKANSGIIEGIVTPSGVSSVASVLVDDMGDDDPSNDFVISAYIDENGAFALLGVSAGTYEVLVEPTDAESDYESASAIGVIVFNGEITTIIDPIVLMLKNGSISGTIAGLAEGVVATVAINDDDSTNVNTNDEGVYAIEEVTPGDYTVTITAEGYDTQNIDVTIDPDEDEVLDVVLVLTP